MSRVFDVNPAGKEVDVCLGYRIIETIDVIKLIKRGQCTLLGKIDANDEVIEEPDTTNILTHPGEILHEIKNYRNRACEENTLHQHKNREARNHKNADSNQNTQQ